MHKAMAGLFMTCLGIQSARADVTTDHQLWMDTTVRTETIDDLKVHFTQHLRMENHGRDIGRLIPEIGLNYRIMQPLSVATGARYSIDRNEDRNTSRSVRIHGDFGLDSPDIGAFEVGYRLRFQRETTQGSDATKLRLRNKVVIKVDTDSGVKPEAFYEHFLNPSGNRGHKAQKYRMGVGMGVKIDNHHRLKFKFFQDKEIDGDGDKERIASLGYRYTI